MILLRDNLGHNRDNRDNDRSGGFRGRGGRGGGDRGRSTSSGTRANDRDSKPRQSRWGMLPISL